MKKIKIVESGTPSAFSTFGWTTKIGIIKFCDSCQFVPGITVANNPGYDYPRHKYH